MENAEIQSLTDAILGRIFVPLEASARHVHLTREQCQQLFGGDLVRDRPLSQPGQYLSKQRVTVIGPKGRFEHVAVLGPPRKHAQVEISMTDSKKLGISPPVRQSGHVENTPGVILEGPMGRIGLQSGVIIAQRHLHLTPEAATLFSVKDKQVVKLQTYTARPTIFQQVVVRVSPEYANAAHLDIDEANACGLKPGELGRLLP